MVVWLGLAWRTHQTKYLGLWVGQKELACTLRCDTSLTLQYSLPTQEAKPSHGQWHGKVSFKTIIICLIALCSGHGPPGTRPTSKHTTFNVTIAFGPPASISISPEPCDHSKVNKHIQNKRELMNFYRVFFGSVGSFPSSFRGRQVWMEEKFV